MSAVREREARKAEEDEDRETRLDVPDAWEPDAQQLEELGLAWRQGRARHELEEVAEVVATARRVHHEESATTLRGEARPRARREHAPVERHPLDVVEEDEARRDEELAKVLDVDAVLLVPLEVDARLGQQLDRLGRVHVVAVRGVVEGVSDEAHEGKRRGRGGRETHLMLNWKLNCHVQTPGASSPFSSHSVMPSWMMRSRSTLHRSVW